MHKAAMDEDLGLKFEAALAAYQRNDLAVAADGCNRMLSADPSHVDAQYLLGLCYGRAGRTDAGMALIQRAIEQNPALENYDFMSGVLLQRNVKNRMQFREELFLQYRLFQLVDAFLISYPKCGRTWLRLLLGKYVIGRGGEGDPLEILQLTLSKPEFSSLEISHDDYPHWKRAEKVVANKQAYAGKKVIFLARDPRDALVSYYFQYTKRGDQKLANDAGFQGSVSDFIRHDIGGLRSLVAFYNAWAKNRDVPYDFLLVRYEDMIGNTGDVLRNIVAFLEWPARDAALIDDIVAFGSFENMRKIEETNSLNNARLKAPENRDPEGFKVRRGKVGGYVDYLLEDDLRYIDEYLQQHLDDYFSFYKQPAIAVPAAGAKPDVNTGSNL